MGGAADASNSGSGSESVTKSNDAEANFKEGKDSGKDTGKDKISYTGENTEYSNKEDCEDEDEAPLASPLPVSSLRAYYVWH